MMSESSEEQDLLLHEFTQQRLSDFATRPAQAVMLAGPTGSGKLALATALAEQLLTTTQKLADYPYHMIIRSEDGKSIGIDAIRGLERFLSLKVPVTAPLNRVIIIEDAHFLSGEAQNALLKTLEEPPAGTCIILTVNYGHALLPTVRSRLQHIAVKRPGQSMANTYFAARGFEEKAVQQAYAISGGLPGLMSALLQDAEHPLTKATEQARRLLSEPVYGRLLMVDELARQRQLALDTVRIIQQMARVSLQTATGPASRKWEAVLNAAYRTDEALDGNVQPKLALTNFVIHF